MRVLIEFEQEEPARLLIAHLQSHAVSAQYSSQSDRHAVVIVDEDDWQQAVARTKTFLQNPSAPEYQEDAWSKGEQSHKHSQFTQGLPAFSLLLNRPFTALIGISCIVVYLFSMMGGFGWVREWMFIIPWPALVYNDQWWRLLTPSLIHFSLLHITFNVLWWFYLGRQIETKFGITLLLVIFIATSIVANLGQLFVSGPQFGGLSGVVYALFGFVWWLGWLRPDWQLSLPKPIIGFMLVWLVIGYADVLWVSMANTAHTLGLVSGCVIAWLLVLSQRHKSNPDKGTS